MAKGFFSQGVAILLNSAPNVDELVPLLEGFKVTGKTEPAASWPMSGPGLTLEYRPKAGGSIQIDVVDKPWPDSMGGVNEDPDLFAAWGLGCFGPFCFPGSLERARMHCYMWKDGPAVAGAHRAFLRIRISYAGKAKPEDAVIPAGTNPGHECEILLAVAEALLEHPAAVCYFNPNGEVLAPRQQMAEICDHYRKASLPAVNLLANRRMVKFQDSDWMMMDLVGMGQLDLPDLEACYTEAYDPNDVAVFLVNTALSMTKPGSPRIKDGHTLTGPKGRLFEARSFPEPKVVPPRKVLRFRPRDGTVSPAELGFGDKPFGKRAWWEFWKL